MSGCTHQATVRLSKMRNLYDEAWEGLTARFPKCTPQAFFEKSRLRSEDHIDCFREGEETGRRVVSLEWMRRGRGPLAEGLPRVRSPLPGTPSQPSRVLRDTPHEV